MLPRRGCGGKRSTAPPTQGGQRPSPSTIGCLHKLCRPGWMSRGPCPRLQWPACHVRACGRVHSVHSSPRDLLPRTRAIIIPQCRARQQLLEDSWHGMQSPLGMKIDVSWVSGAGGRRRRGSARQGSDRRHRPGSTDMAMASARPEAPAYAAGNGGARGGAGCAGCGGVCRLRQGVLDAAGCVGCSGLVQTWVRRLSWSRRRCRVPEDKGCCDCGRQHAGRVGNVGPIRPVLE